MLGKLLLAGFSIGITVLWLVQGVGNLDVTTTSGKSQCRPFLVCYVIHVGAPIMARRNFDVFDQGS